MMANDTKYKMLVGANNDKKGTRFEAGAIVTHKDFSKSTLDHWVNTGKAEIVEEGEKNGKRNNGENAS